MGDHAVNRKEEKKVKLSRGKTGNAVKKKGQK
jgi:hypothetical protein